MSIKYAAGRYMSDALLEGATTTSTGVNAGGLVANVSRSGQLGSGIRFPKLDAANPIVYHPSIIVVLGMPEYFDPFPKMQEVGKSLIETHAKNVSGIDFGYSLNTEDTPVGHDGQTMKVPTRTMRGGVNPSFTFPEYAGNVVYEYFRQWMYFINDPDTNASALPAYLGEENFDKMPGWTMNAYSMTIIVIQPDPSGIPERTIDGAIITNMFPTDIGDVGFERTHGSSSIKERTIAMTGLVQHNRNTYATAIDVYSKLGLHTINYSNALPGIAASADANIAIQKSLRAYGGLEYESTGGTSGVEGANASFKYLGTGGDASLGDLLDVAGQTPITPSGAVKPS